jgi:hypothetical protein
MHIEPGVVDGAKMALGLATAAGAFAVTGKLAWDTIRNDGGFAGLALRGAIATGLVFCFFQVLPHYPVGVSEVHFILGATLFLMLGAGPAAIGLAGGLLAQGLLFAPTDLPMYFINVTTLLVPLWAVSALAKRTIPERTAYVDLEYAQVFKLSTAYQAGVVGWVAFWAFYGQGFGAENVNNVLTFSAAYLLVIVVEPLASLALLAGAKALAPLADAGLLDKRVLRAAA